MSETVPPAAETATAEDLARDAPILRSHVRQVVASAAFRGSRRGRQFLEHIVDKALSGRAEDLKERNLGIELFGRPPAYDTGEDAIVRVTASDVRKRLHQFYAEEGSGAAVRIELPAGAYLPEFRRLAPAIVALPEVRKRPNIRRWAAVVAALAVLAALSLWISKKTPPAAPPLLPWSAILRPDRPVQVILSDPDISTVQELLGFQLSLSDYANRRYLPEALPLTPDLRRVLRSFRGVNVANVDLNIAIRLTELAVGHGTKIRTQNARNFQLASFKSEDPFVLLGSPRSNPWMGLFADQLDFEFAYDDGLKQEVIRNKHPRQGEEAAYIPTAKGFDTGKAYAILAFIENSTPGSHALLLAGTNAEGTEAAGKLVTNAELLSRTLQRYGVDPRGAERHFELLLEVRTMAGSPNTSGVIAFHALRP